MTNLSLLTANSTPYNTAINTAISIVFAPTVQTMSSKEIADLTGKRHDNIKRDIEVMLTQLNLDPLNFEDIFLDSMNREQKGYALDKELSICLVSGYNVQLRMAIVKRWSELEVQAQQNFAVPTTFSQALLLAAQLEEQKEQLALQVAQQQQVIEIQTPKAEVFDAVLDKSRTYSIRDFARCTGVKEKDVKNWLIEKRWMTGTSSATYRPAAWSNVHNYMRMIKQGKTFFDAFGVPHYNERIEFTQDGFNEAVRKMVKSGMMKPLAEEA
ncbi:Rha family transcriptional regulator [Acinetobacter lwoffii]|uniref:Rha family transcriptional regulator n=1 Tax=Acinetobacter lwoffii TaxID=28090 RepID=UPI00168CCBED|nr:Rha family transcriptional regulator [Acinetobacter lwoffii]